MMLDNDERPAAAMLFLSPDDPRAIEGVDTLLIFLIDKFNRPAGDSGDGESGLRHQARVYSAINAFRIIYNEFIEDDETNAPQRLHATLDELWDRQGLDTRISLMFLAEAGYNLVQMRRHQIRTQETP